MPRLPSPEKLKRAHPVMQSLRQIRRGRRITVQRMGEIIGWHANTVSHWENAEMSPSLNGISAYAEALGLKLVLVPIDRHQEKLRHD